MNTKEKEVDLSVLPLALPVEQVVKALVDLLRVEHGVSQVKKLVALIRVEGKGEVAVVVLGVVRRVGLDLVVVQPVDGSVEKVLELVLTGVAVLVVDEVVVARVQPPVVFEQRRAMDVRKPSGVSRRRA